jgi:tRNA(Ile)-lysidine synthase
MIKILGSLPKKVYVACSGGSDSMAILDFLVRGKREVTVAHFNHNTPFGRFAEKFVKGYCRKNNIKLVVGQIQREKLDKESWEEYWRNERYRFFESLDGPVITAHHLDDVVEWWTFTSFHGNPRLIPYQNNKTIRPFLSTSKEEIWNWVDRKSVPYVTDPGNFDEKYMRSLIRKNIIPEALKVNPGLRKVIKKKIEKSFKEEYIK